MEVFCFHPEATEIFRSKRSKAYSEVKSAVEIPVLLTSD